MQSATSPNPVRWLSAVSSLGLLTCVVSNAAGQQYQTNAQQYQQQGYQNRANTQQVPAQQVGHQTPVQTAQNGQAANRQQGYPGASVQPQGQQIPVVKPGQAVQQGNARVAQAAQPAKAPFAPLSAQEQQYLDTVLNVWQQKTAAIKQYECKFTRWQYDPTIHQKDPYSIAKGDIKYMKPDKGLFQVTDLRFREGNGEFKPDPRRPYGEHWICDGDWIHILDANEKKALRQQLPPHMQGALIHRSPLPFLFGVDAKEMKNRYHIRPIRPPQGDQDVWLEAWPKWPDDAGNYSRVQVVISRQDTLPRGIIVFLPNYRADQPHREVYEFGERNVPSGIWNQVKQNVFMQQFIPKNVPSDWKIIEEPYIPPEQQQRMAAQQQSNAGVPR